MSRQVVPLTGQGADALPEPCHGCLVWELGAACPQPRTASIPSRGRAAAQPSDPAVRKQAWVSMHVQEGHPPGRLVLVDGEVAGYALFGPVDAFAPRGPTLPAVSDDALLLATLWVQPVHREVGLGRLLAQAAIKEAIRLDLPAVEVYGDRRWQERSCILPVTWLLHEGFEVHREHLRTPLLRLDTRRTVRWAESLEHAWGEVLGRLPRRVPVPAGDGVPRGVPAPNAVGTERDPRASSRS